MKNVTRNALIVLNVLENDRNGMFEICINSVYNVFWLIGTITSYKYNKIVLNSMDD